MGNMIGGGDSLQIQDILNRLHNLEEKQAIMGKVYGGRLPNVLLTIDDWKQIGTIQVPAGKYMIIGMTQVSASSNSLYGIRFSHYPNAITRFYGYYGGGDSLTVYAEFSADTTVSMDMYTQGGAPEGVQSSNAHIYAVRIG